MICINYLFYFFHVKALRHVKKPKDIEYRYIKNLDKITVKRLCKLTINKKSSFINFKKNKKPNTIRIGCFGESFTYGSEVNKVYDYPNLLQDLFISKGFENIEVINFGNAWHGFHQSFMLWEDVEKKYNLDYVLLGPAFWPDRDTTFNHTQGQSPYFIHSRYILRGNKVEPVDIPGDNYEETFNNYYSFFPNFNSLRFDRHPPAFLECLIPKNRELVNPFYYSKESMQEEAHATYQILWTKIANKMPVILGSYDQKIVNISRVIDKSNLFATKLPVINSFPYKTAMGHNSPLGNQVLARQYFDALTNGKESRLNLLKIKDLENNFSTECFQSLSLCSYDSITFELNNVNLGSFGKPIKSVSLLGVKAPDISLLDFDSIFIPLDFKIKKNMRLILEIEANSCVYKHILDKVEIPHPSLNIGKVDVDDIETLNFRENILNINLQKRFGSKKVLKNGNKIRLFVDEKLIMEGKIVNSKLKQGKLSPLQGSFQRFQPNGNVLIDMDKLDKTGVVFLILKKENIKTRIPFAKWEKITTVVPLGEKPNERILFLNNDGIATIKKQRHS